MSVSDIPANLAARLEALTPAQRALFELALQKQQPARPAFTIPRRARFSPCALSVDQERLWFVQQLDPSSPIYNVYQATRFRTALDPLLLARALQEVVRRQESLRTTFQMIDGRPMQVIAPEQEINLPWVDLRGLPAERREAEALRASQQVVTPAFDLGRLPLLRIVLVQVDEADFVNPLCIHHLVTDWISTYTLLSEIMEIYHALREGRPWDLPELPVQYGDFAEWQRARLSDPVRVEEMVAYWKERLADAPELLSLPYDRPRQSMQTARGRRTLLTLSPVHSLGLRSLAQREGTTLFVALMAAVKALLVRVTGEEKLIVGTPSAHRNLPELERVVGFFLNQLVLYTDLTGNPSLQDVVRRARETAMGAYTHEEMPFAKLVEILRPQRDISRTPFTQVTLLLLAPHIALEGRDITGGQGAENYWVDAHRTQWDFNLSFWESVDGSVLSGWWEYSTDLFDVPTLDRLKEQLRRMVAAFVARPETRLWEVPLLSEAQSHQLLVEWAGEGRVVPGPAIHERFAAHAARTPEAEALVFEERRLTYGELNRWANRLAHQLRRLGAGPETVVGLHLERSPELVAGILGALKAGAAYMVLDPSLPEARLAFQIEDARPVVALTGEDGRLAGFAPAGLRIEPLAELAAAATATHEADEADPAPLAGAGHPAYLIYTSGTTGTPKAVVVEHGQLSTLLAEMESEMAFTAADRGSCLASFTFDLSVMELFPILGNGGTLHLFAVRPALDFPAFLAGLEELTVVHAVPAVMQQVVDAARGTGPYPGVRIVTCGGDRVPPELAAEITALFPRARCFVLYGPTEATVFVTRGLLAEEADAGPRLGTPLGRPSITARVRLVDRHGGAVPLGVAGELVIGGPQVARGYLHRPKLTAEKFPVLDGGRSYRTGDLARWLTDGRLEFLGRIDQQVKVRGFRIEPGEVEAALAALPGVRQAAVVARPTPDGRGHRLVAYVAPETAPETAPGADADLQAALQAGLRQRLPEHMVPGAWVILPELPLTSSGKLDRKNLPEPEAVAAGGEEVLARTPVEELLAGIWAEVLGRPQVGVHDNFFALGGDSILSIQVVTRAQAAGLALTPRMMFLYQTVAELAPMVGTAGRSDAEQGPVTGPVPLTPIQRWFFAQEPPEPWHDNQALILASTRRLDPARLDAALAWTALHHDALRLRFRRFEVNGEEGWEQWLDGPGATSPLLTVDLSALPVAVRSAQVEAAAGMAQRSLDLAAGPLHRPVLFHLGEDGDGGSGRFLWVIHHLAVDGVSWRLLLEDLAAVYDQLEKGSAAAVPALPPKTTSVRRWAERLGELAGSDVLRRETDWWLGRPWDAAAPLPVDGAGESAGTVADERQVALSLEPEETRALLEEVPRVYNSQINDALLSALGRAVHAWSGAPALLVSLEGHGREDLFPGVDLSRTVGWFTSLFPVLLDLREALDPGAALKATKELLRGIPNGGLGWGVLGQSPEAARLAGLPRPQMAFNYLGQLDQGLPAGLPFAAAAEPAGPTRSPRAPRGHLLEWNGSVAGGRLRFLCTYAEGVHRRDSVERLAAGFATALRELIDHCRAPEAGGYTPSDFPLAGLSQGQLDKVLARRKKTR